MKNAGKIASLGVVTGLAVSLMATGVASAHERGGKMGGPRMGGLQAQTFAELDVDGNGQITEEDLKALGAARFAEADTDGNGALSAEELAASAKARMEERRAARAEAGSEGRAKRTPPAGFEAKMAERILNQRDTNKDGALSLAEMTPADGGARMIDRFDTDDDNAISEAEFDAAKAERQARGGERGERGGHGGKHGSRF